MDTHALLWAVSEPRRLPPAVAEQVSDASVLVYASAASAWEIAIKAALGKLTADARVLARGIHDAGFTELPVTIAHASRLRDLPPLHRDPFDRLLVAQALDEGLTIVTHDAFIARYPVPTLWG